MNLETLQAELGEADPQLQEFLSIITALDRLGVSAERVRQIEERALSKLRHGTA